MGVKSSIDYTAMGTHAEEAVGITVGIPRSLHSYEYFPFIAEIVRGILPDVKLRLSPESDNTIKAVGEKSCTTEPCFSVKLAFGHVKTLLDDPETKFVLVPGLLQGEAPEGSFKQTNVCPYTQCFPQMVISAFSEQAERIVPLMIHASLERRPEMLASIIAVAERLGRKVGHKKAAAILDRARAEKQKTQQKLYEVGRETLERAKRAGKPLFVLFGRSYNLSDRALNAGIPGILAERGFESITMDMLDLDPIMSEPEFVDANKHTYWLYHQRLLAAAEFLRRSPGDYRAIYVSNFGCGPDSFIIPQVQGVIGVAKLLVITVDSQDARANVVTRVEAYLNTMEASHAESSDRVFFGKMRTHPPFAYKNRIILLPNMANLAQGLAALFRSYGIPSYAMAATTRESMETGRIHTTGQECYPCITTTGDMVHAAVTGKVYVDRPEMVLRVSPPAKKYFVKDDDGRNYVPFDKKKISFFQGTADGPCRYGQYLPFQNQLFNELTGVGPEDKDGVWFVTFNTEDNYNPGGLNWLGKILFRVRSWKALRFIDFMEKAASLVRPREKNAGETDRVFEESLEKFIGVIEHRKPLDGVIREIGRKFDEIPRRNDPMPIVMMVGEVYVRLNRFANDDTARLLEENGIITLVSPFGTWIKYISAEYYRIKARSNNIVKKLGAWVEWKTLERLEKPFVKAFGSLFDGFPDPTMQELYDMGTLYIDDSYSGEAILSIAEMEHSAAHGFDGALNVMPFTCMPSNIVRAVTPLLQKRYPDFPVAHLEFDGAESPVHREMVEAFIYQVYQHFRMRKNKAAK